MSHTVYLSLGSNLGDRETNICRALRMISDMEGFEMIAQSAIYITEPIDMEDDTPQFMNMVVKGQFKYTPVELLSNLQKIETRLGRTEKGNYKPRAIDIDILLFGDNIIDTDRLTVPHKKMTERGFVLVPLLQIEPDIIHPATDERFDSYLTEEYRNSVILYKDMDCTNVRT